MLPEPGQPPGQHLCLVCGSFGGVDALLNVLLFLPLGVGLALCGLPGKRALLTMFCLSALIEISQFFFIPGRDSTVGDVVTNTLGGALGFAIGRYAWAWLRPRARLAATLTIGWSVIWLVVQSISNYAFAPSLPNSRYYGQLAREIGNLAVFEGRVIAATAGTVVIPNTAFPESHTIRHVLLAGEPVEATVIPAGPTRKIAPIVRVADSDQQEIVLMAQKGGDLVFTMRAGAAVLRLRRPLFALPYAFAVDAAGDRPSVSDTLRLSGRYLTREVTMSAQTGSNTMRLRIPITASLGWVLVLPFDWLIEGTRAEFVLSLIWTAGLLIPFGYWAARIASHSGGGYRGLKTATLPVLATVPLFAIGFVLLPHTFGLSPASAGDLLCALAAVLLGCGLAFRMGTQ